MKASTKYARDGQFSLAKATKKIRGRMRKLRSLVFTTRDGFVGESRRFDYDEAYEAAIAARVKARFDAAAACPKPAPAVQMLRQLNTSDLCAELEQRGYEIHVAEPPLDQDAWAREVLAEVRAS